MLGRDLARAQGWYELRRIAQTFFIAFMGSLGLLTLGSAAWWLRNKLHQLWIPLVGSAFLVLFVFVRASSFHHMDELIGWSIIGLRMNWVFELGGIFLVLYGARTFEKNAHTRRRLREGSAWGK